MNKRKTPVLISISHAVRLAQTNRPRFMRYLAHANITPRRYGWATFITKRQFEIVERKLKNDPLKRGPKKTRSP